jgi:Ca2+-binding EF-hand superfamily protein
LYGYGLVINEVVAFTRQFALQDPPVEKGMYTQLDDGMTWSKETNTVLTIDGAPLEPDKIYRCAVLYLVAMKGIDGVTPLAEWCAANAEDPAVHTDEEAAHGAKEILVEHFSRAVWWNVVKAAGFDEIDKDVSGTITREELSKALEDYYGHDMGDLVLNNLMSVADANGDGVIDRMELLQACFMSASMFIGADTDGDGQLTMAEVAVVLRNALGPAYSEAMAQELFGQADADGTGTVTIAEIKAFAKKRETDLKI